MSTLSTSGADRLLNARIPKSCVAGIVRPMGDVLHGKDWEASGEYRGAMAYFKEDKNFGEDRFEPDKAPSVSPFIGGINPELAFDSKDQELLWKCDPQKKAADYTYYPDEYKSLAKVYEEFIVSVRMTICGLVHNLCHVI